MGFFGWMHLRLSDVSELEICPYLDETICSVTKHRCPGDGDPIIASKRLGYVCGGQRTDFCQVVDGTGQGVVLRRS